MDGKARSGLKVVWIEGSETHAARALGYSEENGFLRFDLLDGRTLRLSKSAILKIEEGP